MWALNTTKRKLTQKTGGHDHPHRRACGNQGHGSQLRTAGKHQQTHGHRLERAHARLDHGHAGHQAPGSKARRHRSHLAQAPAERRVLPPSSGMGAPTAHQPSTCPTCRGQPRRNSALARRLPPGRCSSVMRTNRMQRGDRNPGGCDRHDLARRCARPAACRQPRRPPRF